MHNLDPGKYFFHYTTREAAFGSILSEGRLRLSTYGAMRDPLESQRWRFTFGGYGPRPEDDEALVAQLDRYDAFEAEVNEGVRDRSYLLSLTVDTEPQQNGEREPFCRGWARARMWEQYAENHMGVCLVFDRARLTDAVLRSSAGLVVYDQEVLYDGRGLLKPLVPPDEIGDRGFPAQYINDNHGALFFTKTLDWQTEHEYRFVVIAQDDAPRQVNYGDALYAVIAGERLPAWEWPAILAACETANAEAVRVLWKNWRPGLVDLVERGQLET